MLSNPSTSVDFMPDFQLGGQELELVEEMRLLCLVITSYMKWAANTDCEEGLQEALDHEEGEGA